MKFCLKKIVLWLKNGKQRTLKFEENKVNLITGKQSTGKSTIIEIIDYCFFARTKGMPEGEIIDENVEWYGINFLINDKHFTIARHREEKPEQYYFSSSGDIPPEPFDNCSRKNLKNYIDKEFSLDGNIVFPYGGREIKKNSTISPRYFMLFNTQRRDTLSSKDFLFDKQTNIRYIEALERIFDIALGVSTVENLKKIEKLKDKEKEKNRLENKQKLFLEKKSDFSKEILELCLRAKQLFIVADKIDDNDCLNLLQEKIKILNTDYVDNSNILIKYEEKKLSLELKKSRFKKYLNQYKSYKSLLQNDLESLQPIEYLKDEFQDILNLDNNLDLLVNSLSKELVQIKAYVSSRKHPATIELKSIIKNIDKELKTVNQKISLISSKDNLSKNITQKQQLLFLGEVKAKIPLYSSSVESENYEEEIKKINKSIKLLENDIEHIDRSKVIYILNELMYEIFNQLDYKLGGYEDYKPFFDIKSKQIFLTKLDKFIKHTDIPDVKNIGSSSNHLFLHLTFFLSIHRLFIKQKVPFIPEFLILDQPNTPYYSTDDKEKEIFFKALKMLDEHINYFNNELKRDFQIILLEHVQWKDILKNGSFDNYHLVEEWRDEGDGLIPNYLLDEK